MKGIYDKLGFHLKPLIQTLSPSPVSSIKLIICYALIDIESCHTILSEKRESESSWWAVGAPDFSRTANSNREIQKETSFRFEFHDIQE